MSTPARKENGQIIPKSNKDQNLGGYLKQMSKEIERAVPKHLSADRMARVILTALRTTPRLAECTPGSFVACVMNTSQLGLEPNTPLGLSYLIPRKNGKTGRQECTLLIGYQGYLELASRSGQLAGRPFAFAVREGDAFEYTLGLEPTITHVPSHDENREERPITHVYAVARQRDGDPVFKVLSRAQVEARKNRSAAAKAGFSPWKTDEEAMYLKTAIRALWPWLPKSIAMANAEAVQLATDAGRVSVETVDTDATKRLATAGVFLPDAVVEPDETEDAIDVEAGPRPAPPADPTAELSDDDLNADAAELVKKLKRLTSEQGINKTLEAHKPLLELLSTRLPDVDETVQQVINERRSEIAGA